MFSSNTNNPQCYNPQTIPPSQNNQMMSPTYTSSYQPTNMNPPMMNMTNPYNGPNIIQYVPAHPQNQPYQQQTIPALKSQNTQPLMMSSTTTNPNVSTEPNKSTISTTNKHI